MIVKFGSHGDDLSFRLSASGASMASTTGGCGCISTAFEMSKAVEGGKAFQEITEAQALKEFRYVSLARLGLELVDGISQVQVAANGRQILG